MFNRILESNSGTLSISTALICMGAAIIFGIIIALVHMYSTKCSKNFAITIAVLPLLVQVVIMMVNGNLGTSIAILGSFSLIRFRSMQGNSRELVSIFFAMAIGLAVGMGHIMYAFVFTLITSLALIILQKSSFGMKKNNEKSLKVTIPENLDYINIFDDIFDKYTNNIELNKIKTTNMGSMFELSYNISLKNNINEKDFIDEIRTRNGNLTVNLGRVSTENEL